MAEARQNGTQWFERPLCRHYALAIFDATIVRLRDADGLHDLQVRWAFGWLANGECEALDVWLADSEAGSGDPRQLIAGLQARGVERIWNLVDTHTGTSTNAGQDQERASRIPKFEAAQVREGLTRAVRRHGSFASEAAVLDFMTGALRRAERRLDRERLFAKGKPRLESGVQMAPSGI